MSPGIQSGINTTASLFTTDHLLSLTLTIDYLTSKYFLSNN